MSVKTKYQAVLNLGEKLGVRDGEVSEENGILIIRGKTRTPYEKDLLWDKIKEIGGQKPTDIKADITVEDDAIYHRHVVKSGDSLSKIARHYYGDAMKYKLIFSANKNILNNPDVIYADQVLVIPKL